MNVGRTGGDNKHINREIQNVDKQSEGAFLLTGGGWAMGAKKATCGLDCKRKAPTMWAWRRRPPPPSKVGASTESSDRM